MYTDRKRYNVLQSHCPPGTVCHRAGAVVALRAVEDALPVLLKRLTIEYLGEEVGSVVVRWDVLDGHTAGAAQLAHLEELPVDVSRMLRRGVAVAEAPRARVVCTNVDSLVDHVAD